jgi:hypothetical protein
MRLHYAKNNRKSATFFAPQRFPKAPRSIDKQRKTSNLNGLLVFLIWSGIRESNPLKSTVKPLKTLHFLL